LQSQRIRRKDEDGKLGLRDDAETGGGCSGVEGVLESLGALAETNSWVRVGVAGRRSVRHRVRLTFLQMADGVGSLKPNSALTKFLPFFYPSVFSLFQTFIFNSFNTGVCYYSVLFRSLLLYQFLLSLFPRVKIILEVTGLVSCLHIDLTFWGKQSAIPLLLIYGNIPTVIASSNRLPRNLRSS
jgi:hypothetical protein